MSVNPRQETVDEKRMVESMVTAILTQDAQGQALAVFGCSEREERIVRAGAQIIASFFTVLARDVGVAPSRLWREQLRHINVARELPT